MTGGKQVNVAMRWLSACGVIAPILDVLIMIWLGSLDPNYSHARQYISELGEAGRPYAAVFTAWCLLWGLLFAGFAVAMRRGLGEHKGAWLGPGAVFLMAAISIVVGLFPCDPGCAGRTVSGQVHQIVGGWLGTPATILVPLLSWVGMRRDEAWRGYRALTLILLANSLGRSEGADSRLPAEPFFPSLLLVGGGREFASSVTFDDASR
jgi:hypothetical protein